MERDRASWTAESTAALRADHLLHDPDPIFHDDWALRLTSHEMRAGVESGGLRRGLTASGMRPTQGHIVARARYAEDAFASAYARGVRQLVVLAAGLDSFALRRGERWANVRVFEVDHPASQRIKRDRLAGLGAKDLGGVEYVPVDFERESVADGLARTGFASGEPTVLSWMGVIMYLTRDAGLRTLESIAQCTAAGSVLAFDYPLPYERMAPDVRAIAEQKNRALVERGEPRLSTFDPDVLRQDLEKLGFRWIENATSDVLDARYFAGRGDDLRANPENCIACVETT